MPEDAAGCGDCIVHRKVEDAAQDAVTVTPEHRKVEDATQDVVTVTLEHQKVRMRVVQPSLCPQTRAVWPLWPRWE